MTSPWRSRPPSTAPSGGGCFVTGPVCSVSPRGFLGGLAPPCSPSSLDPGLAQPGCSSAGVPQGLLSRGRVQGRSCSPGGPRWGSLAHPPSLQIESAGRCPPSRWTTPRASTATSTSRGSCWKGRWAARGSRGLPLGGGLGRPGSPPALSVGLPQAGLLPGLPAVQPQHHAEDMGQVGTPGSVVAASDLPRAAVTSRCTWGSGNISGFLSDGSHKCSSGWGRPRPSSPCRPLVSPAWDSISPISAASPSVLCPLLCGQQLLRLGPS